MLLQKRAHSFLRSVVIGLAPVIQARTLDGRLKRGHDCGGSNTRGAL